MKQFMRLAEFRQLQSFKTLHPFLRKTLIAIDKEFPESLFEESGKYFINHYINQNVLNDFFTENVFDVKTQMQDEKISKLLNKISIFNNCISTYNNNDGVNGIYRFTFIKSNRIPEFIFHTTDVSPDIIMKEGIIRHYSLGVKAFPPLVFVGTKPCWIGQYIYTIKTNKQLYIDTNLDWKRRDTKPYLCLKESIMPDEIIKVGKYDRI